MATSDMAVEAARCALAQRGIPATDLDAIIVCTVTPDMLFPSTACLVQDRLGAKGAWGFDLIAACSSFVYGLTTGAHLVMGGTHKKVLVIGADTMSRIIDYTDRTTCVLFGDGAGAMLLEPAGEGEDGAGFIDFLGEVDGSGGQFLKMPAGGSRMPASHETVDKRLPLRPPGRAAGLQVRRPQDVRSLPRPAPAQRPDRQRCWIFIPHQANLRIISNAADRLGLAPEQVMVNIDRYGNTTAATIPLATRDAIAQGRLKKGDLVLFAAVGAGYTVGASLWRWAY